MPKDAVMSNSGIKIENTGAIRHIAKMIDKIFSHFLPFFRLLLIFFIIVIRLEKRGSQLFYNGIFGNADNRGSDVGEAYHCRKIHTFCLGVIGKVVIVDKEC